MQSTRFFFIPSASDLAMDKRETLRRGGTHEWQSTS